MLKQIIVLSAIALCGCTTNSVPADDVDLQEKLHGTYDLESYTSDPASTTTGTLIYKPNGTFISRVKINDKPERVLSGTWWAALPTALYMTGPGGCTRHYDYELSDNGKLKTQTEKQCSAPLESIVWRRQ